MWKRSYRSCTVRTGIKGCSGGGGRSGEEDRGEDRDGGLVEEARREGIGEGVRSGDSGSGSGGGTGSGKGVAATSAVDIGGGRSGVNIGGGASSSPRTSPRICWSTRCCRFSI